MGLMFLTIHRQKWLIAAGPKLAAFCTKGSIYARRSLASAARVHLLAIVSLAIGTSAYARRYRIDDFLSLEMIGAIKTTLHLR